MADTCRACGAPIRREKKVGAGANPKHIDGIDDLCANCAAEARVCGTVEKFLARRLGRMAGMADTEPCLSGDLPSLAAAEAMSEDAAWETVCRMRWPKSGGKPVCPKCGHRDTYTITTRKRFRCADQVCRHEFTALSKTVFSSFKKGYRGLLIMLAYGGKVRGGPMADKTAIDWRRRKSANDGRSKRGGRA